MNTRKVYSSCFILVLVLLPSCVTPPPPSGTPDLFNFIVNKETYIDEIILRLGVPSSTYDNGRIIAYEVAKYQGGYFIIQQNQSDKVIKYSAENKCDQYHLVLVFSKDGLLQQHNLVRLSRL